MGDSVQICVFDMRRGVVEGQELDKILFFWPSTCPLPAQLSLIGLSEGLITFTRIFSPETPCELMEAERHTHVFHDCEPDLWMVMVVEKSKDNDEAPRVGALRAVLKEAHDLFCLLYGTIRDLLDAHPDGHVARSCLHAFFPDYILDFIQGKKLRFTNLYDSLTERGFLQLHLPQPQVLLDALSIQGILKSCLGGKTVRHVLIMFQKSVLSTTLPLIDTGRLFQYSLLRILPLALSQSTSRPAPRDLVRSASPTNSTSRNGQAQSSTILNGTTGGEAVGRNLSPAVDHGLKFYGRRPLALEAWWRKEDGFLETDSWGTREEGGNAFPEVWLQSTNERMRLCIYQCKALTTIMLIPTSSGPEIISNLKTQLLVKASNKLQSLEKTLSKDWPGVNAWHVPGYRYLFCDLDHKVSRFSPASKVATLSKETLAALNRIRAELDLESLRMERATFGRDNEFELCLKTKQNSWIIVRRRGGCELYTVFEKSSHNLLLASQAVESFDKQYFNGCFWSDL